MIASVSVVVNGGGKEGSSSPSSAVSTESSSVGSLSPPQQFGFDFKYLIFNLREFFKYVFCF